MFSNLVKNRLRNLISYEAQTMKTTTIYAEPWHVYIAECNDKTLYVGVARNAKRRIKNHNTTNKCRYTRFRKPLKMVYTEKCSNYNIARKRESEIKRFSRKKKLALLD